MLHEFLIAFVGDVILSNGSGQVDAVVQIPTPKDIDMRFKRLPLFIEMKYNLNSMFSYLLSLSLSLSLSVSLPLSYIPLGMQFSCRCQQSLDCVPPL